MLSDRSINSQYHFDYCNARIPNYAQSSPAPNSRYQRKERRTISIIIGTLKCRKGIRYNVGTPSQDTFLRRGGVMIMNVCGRKNHFV